jgi:hypothetical protein
MRTLAFVSSESKKPPKGRLLGAACNLTFYGSGHRDARPAHGITGRRQLPVCTLDSMGGVNNQLLPVAFALSQGNIAVFEPCL